MFSKISNYITDMIYETMPDVEPERREVIEYGVYMTVSEIVKITFIIIIGIIFNIFVYVVGAIAIFGIQRTFMGGVHAKSHWGCVISQSLVIFSALLFSFTSNVDRLYLLPLAAIFSFITAYKYAPADLVQKPIKSKRQRKKLRIAGFIILTLLTTAALFVPLVWSNIIIFTCFIQALFMTPLAYKVSGNKHGGEEVTV